MSYRARRRILAYRRRRGRGDWRALAVAGAFIVLAAFGVHGVAAHGSSPAAPSGTAQKIISFAQSQEGCPYVYGGTGPCEDGWDCSGLTQAAYAAAGISIPRTSEEQWAAGPQVSDPQPGDLVFFTGSPVDPPPGHVAIYVGPGQIIDAYASGYPVRQQSFGEASSWEGLGTPTGYTDPMEGS